MILFFLVLGRCEAFHISNWHHLTSSEHWEQQESTVSPLDKTGLDIEGEILIEEEERTSFFGAWCGDSVNGGGVDDVDGDHGGGFGDKMIFSKQL